MRHNTVIVTAAAYVMRGESSLFAAPDIEAFRASLPEEWGRLLVGPVRSVVEDFQTFAFLPDGSHEGWPDSDRGDLYRQQFIDLFSATCEGASPFDVLVVDARFGGDEPGAGYEPELIASVNPHVTATG